METGRGEALDGYATARQPIRECAGVRTPRCDTGRVVARAGAARGAAWHSSAGAWWGDGRLAELPLPDVASERRVRSSHVPGPQAGCQPHARSVWSARARGAGDVPGE